jgi:hypothetical protein
MLYKLYRKRGFPVKRTVLTLILACSVSASFAQSSPSADDRKLARNLSSAIVYLQTMADQCKFSKTEKTTVARFATMAITNAFNENQAHQPSVSAGAREGKVIATADLAKGSRSAACEKARKTIEQIGNKMEEDGDGE